MGIFNRNLPIRSALAGLLTLPVASVLAVSNQMIRDLAHAGFKTDHGIAQPIANFQKIGFILRDDASDNASGAQVNYHKIQGPTTLHFKWEASREAGPSENAFISVAADDGETQLETEIIHDMDSESQSGSFVKYLESDQTYLIQIGIVSSDETEEDDYTLTLYGFRQSYHRVFDPYTFYENPYLRDPILAGYPNEGIGLDGNGDPLTYIPFVPVPRHRTDPDNIPGPTLNRTTPLTPFNNFYGTGDALTKDPFTPFPSDGTLPDNPPGPTISRTTPITTLSTLDDAGDPLTREPGEMVQTVPSSSLPLLQLIASLSLLYGLKRRTERPE